MVFYTFHFCFQVVECKRNKNKKAKFCRLFLISLIFAMAIIFIFLLCHFNNFLRLYATADMSIHLPACFIPLVFTLRMATKLTRVPSTGSTVALRSCRIFSRFTVCRRACIRSYKCLSTVSSIFLKSQPWRYIEA